MGKIKTGFSTDEEFRKSLTDKGANLRIDSTPKELLNAFLETGSFVSYQSPNEVILQAINEEEPVEEYIPWESETAKKTFVFKPRIELDTSDPIIAAVIAALPGASGQITFQVSREGFEHDEDDVGSILLLVDDGKLTVDIGVSQDDYSVRCEYNVNETFDVLTLDSGQYIDSVDSSKSFDFSTDENNVVTLPDQDSRVYYYADTCIENASYYISKVLYTTKE